jgi:uncharacterized protein YrrD
MQHSLHSLIGYVIGATDGDLGKVDEFYFDDITWTIRYMVVETGNWLLGRKVLISIAALGKPDWELHTFPVNLTCEQVRNSPDIDTERPVYRQHEVKLFDYYQWPQYWEGGYQGALGITPFPLLENPILQEPPAPDRQDDPHLRSTRQITDYQIHATNGEIGHVADFIVDDENWALCNLVVDTGNWLPGKKVIISPAWIKSVNWDDASVTVDRMRESIKNSPDVDPSKAIVLDNAGPL